MLNVMSVLSVIVETRETLLKPFQTRWKGIIIDQIPIEPQTSEELTMQGNIRVPK